MLRLRSSILAHLLPSSPATSPAPPLRRLLSVSAIAPAISPSAGFAAEDYLVATCGLTRPQALKASPKLSHLKSPTNPDAVLAFLAGLGLSGADVAAVVAKDPQLLCAKVEKTLAPNVAELTGLGLSRPEIARLVSLAGATFRCRSIISGLQYCLPLFGSSENLLRALKSGSVLGSDLERVVKPNVTFLQECGLGVCDIAKLYVIRPSPLSISTERIRAAVACAEGLGVPRGSQMFRHALQAVAFLSEEKVAAKVEHLKKAFRWSDAEVGIAFSKAPALLMRAKESLQRRSEFLINEVGLQPAYIAQQPAIVCYSLEGRLRPRYHVVKFLKENGLLMRDPHVVKFLKENGLLMRDPSYSAVFKEAEKVFREKFICPYKEAAPHLEEDYDAACKGKLSTNFRFT
ncbi:hypothetical protein CFC21_050089 [Triticum aestivum]|uniref:Uncharacterized protein n=2 Tax=Triticum aestivum TaxID=4565 RepID=A0A3B6H5P6_WHEAT|nr:uncharacterized protein LOC123080704 [Triticum aestivum]KAF7040167.1 hypothetical protein CFC21_050089 [Triticum aestivum]